MNNLPKIVAVYFFQTDALSVCFRKNDNSCTFIVKYFGDTMEGPLVE